MVVLGFTLFYMTGFLQDNVKVLLWVAGGEEVLEELAHLFWLEGYQRSTPSSIILFWLVTGGLLRVRRLLHERILGLPLCLQMNMLHRRFWLACRRLWVCQAPNFFIVKIRLCLIFFKLLGIHLMMGGFVSPLHDLDALASGGCVIMLYWSWLLIKEWGRFLRVELVWDWIDFIHSCDFHLLVL